MKFLITGGAGFIGANYLHYVVNKYKDDEFINVDKLTYAGNLDNLKDIENKENYKFVYGDIADREFIYNLFDKEKFDYVINFAAESHVDRSIEDPECFIKTNVLGTSILLDACLKYGITRFHQISTDEVYGDLPLDKPELMFKEDSIIKPSSPYSASKASADMLVLAYHRTYKLPVTISRCSNNYGPYQHNEKLIPKMIEKAMYNEPLTIYGHGHQVRDWIHVDDHCIAVDMIVRMGKTGEIYNIGGYEEVSNNDVVSMILDILDKPHSLIVHVDDRLGHDLRYAIDCTKLQNELGWKTTHSFKEGLKETINWYVKRL